MANVRTDVEAEGAGPRDVAVVVEDVSHVFRPRSGNVEALSDVRFAVKEGTFLGLVGPSGCGKSSLLLIIAGLLRPTAGRVLLYSEPVERPRPDRVSLIFQEANLLPWKTSVENVEFPLELRGVPRTERRARAMELLLLVGLAGFAGQYPHELSGGMKQRVAIARGLIQNPRVLLMDEPFGALDEQTRMRMGRELLRIWEKTGTTILFVTHSLTEAVFLCDRVVIFSQRPGTVLEELTVDLGRPRTFGIMASERFGMLRDKIWRLIMTDED